MSYDFATEQRCPHQVFFENSQTDLAQGFVYFDRQPAHQQSVALYLDGVQIPQYGLYSYAELPIGRAEPYRIRAGENDLLYIGVGGEVPSFVQLLTGPAVKATELAADLQKKIPSLQVLASNKHVIFRSRSQFNGGAFQFPDPRWTDKSSSSPLTARSLAAFKYLGIVPGRVVSGTKIVPGWSMIQSPISPIVTDKAIQFNTTLRNFQPLIQTSYVTAAGNCRRCFGSRIEFDYGISNGSYETVQDTDLLSQEFDKFVFSRLGSHWKWTWLGSQVMDRIGTKSNGTRSSASALITLDITQAYKVYENIKKQQEQRFPQQKNSDAEMPSSLDGLNVQSSPDDPTTAVVTISVRNRSAVSIPLTRVIGTPNPFYLTGGNQPYILRG